ncbi:hypothetical protein APS67_000827 [Streptomyces sp. AVP053U2]|nr:hypothetical protein APS67_000827 [Streptomyces sp. AVP053U2]
MVAAVRRGSGLVGRPSGRAEAARRSRAGVREHPRRTVAPVTPGVRTETARVVAARGRERAVHGLVDRALRATTLALLALPPSTEREIHDRQRR